MFHFLRGRRRIAFLLLMVLLGAAVWFLLPLILPSLGWVKWAAVLLVAVGVLPLVLHTLSLRRLHAQVARADSVGFADDAIPPVLNRIGVNGLWREAVFGKFGAKSPWTATKAKEYLAMIARVQTDLAGWQPTQGTDRVYSQFRGVTVAGRGGEGKSTTLGAVAAVTNSRRMSSVAGTRTPSTIWPRPAWRVR
jgi:hypothetical protein